MISITEKKIYKNTPRGEAVLISNADDLP